MNKWAVALIVKVENYSVQPDVLKPSLTTPPSPYPAGADDTPRRRML